MCGKQCPMCAQRPGEQRGFDLEHVQSGTLGQGLWGVIMSVCSRAQVASLQRWAPTPPPAPAWPVSLLPALGSQPVGLACPSCPSHS